MQEYTYNYGLSLYIYSYVITCITVDLMLASYTVAVVQELMIDMNVAS